MHRWTAAAVAFALVTSLATGTLADSAPGEEAPTEQVEEPYRTLQEVAQDLVRAGIVDVGADHYAAGSIALLVNAGLLTPDANGNFFPDQVLNGADGVAVFAKVLGIASKTDSSEVAFLKAQMAGIGENLSPADPLRRIDLARILAAALGIAPKPVIAPEDYPFSDYAAATAADRGILATLYEVGVFKGYEDRTFRPDNTLTRTEIAILVDRLLGAAW